ncbi:AAA family ATPase [Geomonas sp. Red32]|uniref:AAA family ATPase n=1 Tax=Geomonas sp. Red32 TaxID=2912856 RepID=UPI00202CE2DC|nr:AAA family ATPase [Geomonas sp. Red32]MCM0082882.1 AAA family ATPase [Geomonas sp. Red32]
MASQFSIVIIDKDEQSRESIASTLRPYSETVTLAGSVDNFADGALTIQKASPNVVILGVDSIEQGIKDVQFITLKYPRVSVIACSSEKNVEWFLSIMRAGAVEYLLRPIGQEELKQSLQKVGRFLLPTPGEEMAAGEIIAVYNPIGGMGTTTVAVNLAAALAEEGTKVALVDLNLEAGDVNTFLNVNPTYTLSSVTTNVQRLDANFLMSVMTRHVSGPFVLTEPVEVDEAASITPEQVQRVLELLRGIFSYVVVDCVGQLAGCNLAIFSSAHRILFTTTLSLPALKNTKRYLSAMERKGFSPDLVKLVINRYQPKSDIQLKDAEKVLGRNVYQSIPNEYLDVVNSINKGIPVVKLAPRSPVSKAIQGLANRIKE